ncbi:hypothetical protein, partial [Paraburkholderia caribensis]|uniref:hypothetical protein n=1 Tax=Paraburkholderia caribensis TaxID=75105 RepID=UPI0031E127E4
MTRMFFLLSDWGGAAEWRVSFLTTGEGGGNRHSGLVFLFLSFAFVFLLLLLRWRPCFAFVGRASPVGVFSLFAGIRDSLARFKRRPCAGRHLLFFAAAKKSRQKKAAHTASANSCLRAP